MLAIETFFLCVVVHEITSLERMEGTLRIKEGLKVSQFLNNHSISNGLSCEVGEDNSLKVESSIKVYLYWFMVLISN